MSLLACRRVTKTASGQRGQALLELVPVVLVLLLLIFGVIESSYAIWQLEVITALSREGSNLASRNTALSTTADTVIIDGANLNLANNGKVIVTAVQNQGGTMLITAQASSGSFNASSRIGKTGAKATIPTTTTPIPLNGSIYVTEVFTTYTAITPLGDFVKITMPSVLYDVAYF